MDEEQLQYDVLEDLKGNMDDRILGGIKKRQSGPADLMENKARAEFLPGDGSQNGIEFAENGSDVAVTESEASANMGDYDDEEKEMLQSQEYEALMG